MNGPTKRESRTDDWCEGGKRSPNKEPHARELDDSHGLVRSLESTAEQSFSTPTPTRHAEELVEQAAAHGECHAETMRAWIIEDWDTCIGRSRLDSTLIAFWGWLGLHGLGEEHVFMDRLGTRGWMDSVGLRIPPLETTLYVNSHAFSFPDGVLSSQTRLSPSTRVRIVLGCIL